MHFQLLNQEQNEPNSDATSWRLAAALGIKPLSFLWRTAADSLSPAALLPAQLPPVLAQPAQLLTLAVRRSTCLADARILHCPSSSASAALIEHTNPIRQKIYSTCACACHHATNIHLLIRQVLFVNLALAEVPKSLDGLKLNGIRTLQ